MNTSAAIANMDESGGLRLKWQLRCGLGGRLLEWHS
jgi:hypothetical protein